MRTLIAIAMILAAATEGCSNDSSQCSPTGSACNDGLCFNGAADGVCDQDGKCNTQPSNIGTCTVFLTQSSYAPGIGGLAGADQACQDAARQAGLKGTFKAWLSDSRQSAAQRLTHSVVPYVDLKGRAIANDWSDLTGGSVHRAITVDQNSYDWDADADHCSFPWEVFTQVWTGTRADGSAEGPFCNDWTSDDEGTTGAVGMYCDTSSEWTCRADPAAESCGLFSNFYCFQQ